MVGEINILPALAEALFGVQEEDYLLTHLDIKQTDEQARWHHEALKQARERHGKPFTWGSHWEKSK